jgi:hypothetical protein
MKGLSISGENGIILHALPVCFMQVRVQGRAASMPQQR